MSSANPFALVDPRSGAPILEMKLGMVLYLASAPGPALARAAYELFMARWGHSIRFYCATSPGSVPLAWTPRARLELEQSGLPSLRQRQTWGYGLASGHGLDEILFMVHGSRPSSEAGKASFIRLDLPWNADPQQLRAFAAALSDFAPFEWGTGGLIFQKSVHFFEQSMNEMYAKARRYWGIEAHNLDVTLWHALSGLKCVNWVTAVGTELAARSPSALTAARARAFAVEDRAHGTLFVTDPTPRYIDRNIGDPLGGYERLGKALEPLQMSSHGSLGGSRWTEDNTCEYIRRFSTGVP